MDRNLLQLNSPIMTKLIRDKFLPVVQVETFNNTGTLSEAFGNGSIVKQVAMPTGKLDVMFGKGRHASFGAFQDDYTFDHADGRTTGYEGVVRSRGFQSNARIDIVPNKRLNTAEAFFNIFEEQFTDNAKTAKEQFSRMLYGNGSGVITTTTAQSAGAKLYGSSTDNAFVVKFADIRHFQIDDLVTFGVKTTIDTAEGTRTNADGKTVGHQLAGLERATETDAKAGTNGGVYEKSWNRGATFGIGNIDMSTLITARINDIDDEDGSVYFLLEEAYLESTGAAPTATAIADNSVVYNRRSINGDIHGLDYMIKGSAEKANSELFGIGAQTVTAYGTGVGMRPAMLLSKTRTIKNFLDEATYEKFMDDIELRGKDRPDLIVTTKAIRRSIASTNQGATQSIVRLMRPSTAIADNDKRSLGHGEVDLKGEVITTDRHAPKGKIWFLSMPTYTMAIENEMEFDDYDGVMWKQRIVSNVPATGGGRITGKRQMSYEANMFSYREMFCTNPRGNGRIDFTDAKIIKPAYKGQYAVDAKDFGEKEDQFGAEISDQPLNS